MEVCFPAQLYNSLGKSELRVSCLDAVYSV